MLGQPPSLFSFFSEVGYVGGRRRPLAITLGHMKRLYDAPTLRRGNISETVFDRGCMPRTVKRSPLKRACDGSRNWNLKEKFLRNLVREGAFEIEAGKLGA